MILIERLRHHLATANAVPQLAILGVLAGFSTGVVMLLFRAIVELPLMALLPGHNSENFEGLTPVVRVCLVVGGALLLGLWTQGLDPQRQSVGVVHVMERLNAQQGRMPLANAVVQFIGGAAALLTGQSGGREGPAIHLGAAASSLLGQFLELPNNSIRTLVACGTAAAIAGSFNTPLAGRHLRDGSRHDGVHHREFHSGHPRCGDFDAAEPSGIRRSHSVRRFPTTSTFTRSSSTRSFCSKDC